MNRPGSRLLPRFRMSYNVRIPEHVHIFYSTVPLHTEPVAGRTKNHMTPHWLQVACHCVVRFKCVIAWCRVPVAIYTALADACSSVHSTGLCSFRAGASCRALPPPANTTWQDNAAVC
ncbi:hypothetical protein NDU88_001444 [Pleurodeles waltl]|uniref:Uncharacterized protein n=1 Tax=Pleurodeles waltl TaxID=8319 RepID=A0AAV7RB47_PLEWA|nr:hypothetical protein NDU88_001444 [Pleurodeles waltl]